MQVLSSDEEVDGVLAALGESRESQWRAWSQVEARREDGVLVALGESRESQRRAWGQVDALFDPVSGMEPSNDASASSHGVEPRQGGQTDVIDSSQDEEQHRRSGTHDGHAAVPHAGPATPDTGLRAMRYS